MNRSSGFIDFAAVKAAVSLEQILRHYGVLDQLKPSGKEGLRGCCPIHGGTNPDQFCVSLAKNAWNCFSECQRGGNQLDFIMVMEKCQLSEAAWKANEWFSLGLEKQAKPRFRNDKPEPKEGRRPARSETKMPECEASEGSPAPPSQVPSQKLAIAMQEETGSNKPMAFTLQNLDPAHSYPTERGLEAATIAEFGLGYCAKGTMAGRIVIPIHNLTGDLVAYAGRWPGPPPEGKEKYRFPGGFKKSLEMFNAHRAFAEDSIRPMVIVEGFFDAIYLWQHGCRSVIALMGSHLSLPQELLLLDAISENRRHIVLALDNDEAGRKGTDLILPRLAPHAYVRVHRFPEEGGQPDGMSMEAIRAMMD